MGISRLHEDHHLKEKKLNMRRNEKSGGANTQKKSKKKWLFWGIGAVATGVLSYFGLQYWNKNKEADGETKSSAPEFTANAKRKTTATPKADTTKAKPGGKAATASKTSATPGDSFPLKKGSKGDAVKAVQEAIISKYGKNYLPKGADGIFGNELQAALKKLNLPATIDQTTYNVLVQKKDLDAVGIAKALFTAAGKKDYNTISKLLKGINSVKDYTAVNEVFKNYFLRGVRQTLVNGILGTFSNEKQKEAIRLAFVNIGLKYDGKKWALAGIAEDQPLLITTKPTKVWRNPRTSVTVPANMVLGKEVAKRKGHTMFESEGGYFIVNSNDINYYKQ
jgi:hypothetical protein